MKNIFYILFLFIICQTVDSQNLPISLSEANGNGWAPLSTTPHSVILYEKSTIYPLSISRISTKQIKGFKIMFQEIPSAIKIFVRGDDKSGKKISKLLSVKLVGTCMDYSIENFDSVDKIGIYYLGNTTNTPVQIRILNFSLISKTGVEIPTILPNNTDAQKNITNWVRLIGYSGDIVFNGSYNREVEWSPAEFNKYNELIIKFKKPVQTGIKLKINKSRNGNVTNEIIDIPYNCKTYTLNLKKNFKLSGFFLNKMSLISSFQGSKIEINHIYLSE